MSNQNRKNMEFIHYCNTKLSNINEYNIIKKPVSDGGVIVDRVLVDKNNIRNWLKEQEENGAALTAQTLAALFYINEV